MTRPVMLDAYVGSCRDLRRLLDLLRDLHNGSAGVGGLTRLQAIEAVCERLVDVKRQAVTE